MYKAGLGRAEPELQEAAPEPEPALREPTIHGTTEADYLHVSPEEAEEARNMYEVEEELPAADREFDEELEDIFTRTD